MSVERVYWDTDCFLAHLKGDPGKAEQCDGKRAEDVTGELGDRIKALVYEYSGRMPLAAAVGVLHLVAYEITTDSD